MKYMILIAGALALAGPALAQDSGHDDHAGHAPAPTTDAADAEAVGKIKSLDAKSGKVTIHHGPIASLGWPAMTMTFQATPELLKSVKAGQTVKFTVKAPGNQITAIQPQ